MPWKESQVVDERLRFVARLLDGEKMSGTVNQRKHDTSRKLPTQSGGEGPPTGSRRVTAQDGPWSSR
jgi:hypothetical protein